MTFTDNIELFFSEKKQYDKDTFLVLDARLINEKNQLPLLCQHIKKVLIVGENFTPSQQIQFIYEGACEHSDKLIDTQLITRTVEGILNNETWLKHQLIPQMLKGIVAKQSFLEHKEQRENQKFKTISILRNVKLRLLSMYITVKKIFPSEKTEDF